MYRFPKDLEKKAQWLAALPNVLDGEKTNLRICCLHWPDNVTKEKPYRSPVEVCTYVLMVFEHVAC